jgi:peptide/nickel transport system ATP-binding protein
VLQEPAAALNPVLRIGDHVSEVLRAHGRGDRRSRREAVYALFREVRLPDPERLYDAYPHQLSGGERQRAAIAQALACRPALLIADEPTTALDATTQAQILELFRELRSRFGMAILMITHDPAELTGFADRMIVLHEGRIVEDSPFDDVCRDPRHPYTRSLLPLMRPSLEWRAQSD